MLPIVSFVFLISCSALAKSENEALSVWWDPEIPSHSESVNSSMDGSRIWLLNFRKSAVLCCVCQKAVKRAKKKITEMIEKKIYHECNKFKKKFQSACHERAAKYGIFILRTLFPGKTPKDTCKKITLCNKQQ